MEKVTVIGLGYVGLPFVCLCVEKGLQVNGVDVDSSKIKMLKQGISPIEDSYLNEKVKNIKEKVSESFEAIRDSSAVIVCVPTPVDDNHMPELSSLTHACEQISKNLQPDTLVVIESTIFPGTTEDIVFPILKKSNVSFYLAHCPERIDPGNKKYSIKNLPRVLAGIDEESTSKASEFYKKIIDAEIIELTSVKAAEATKMMENSFRDVNIAFVNEMAKSFDKAGIDVLEVIRGASTKPFGFMPHYPGSGVGGHCIPTDPYYLIEKAKSIGFNHKFLSLARKINEGMPYYTVELLENELKKQNKALEDAKIGILGVAYKANVDDTRESPALKVINILKGKNAKLFVFDPYVKKQSNVHDLKELLEKSDYIVLVTDHAEFRGIASKKLKENNIKIIVDGRNCLDKEKIKSMGIAYHGIGTS